MFQQSIERLLSPLKGVLLINVSAVLLILGSALGLWHTITHHPVIQHETAVESVVLSRDADHLFGTYQAPLTVAAAEKLQLKGIFAANDPASGAAIIAKKGQAAKLYVVGDLMPGGARLMAVREAEVELEVRGERSILKLPEKYLAGLSGTPAVSSQ